MSQTLGAPGNGFALPAPPNNKSPHGYSCHTHTHSLAALRRYDMKGRGSRGRVPPKKDYSYVCPAPWNPLPSDTHHPTPHRVVVGPSLGSPYQAREGQPYRQRPGINRSPVNCWSDFRRVHVAQKAGRTTPPRSPPPAAPGGRDCSRPCIRLPPAPGAGRCRHVARGGKDQHTSM